MPLPASKCTIHATIAVALRSIPKDTVMALTSRAWPECEATQGDIADRIVAALDRFEIEDRPMPIENRMDRC